MFQKNSASASLASTTLSFPIFINPFWSFLFATIKNSLVILPLLSKVGKYFWCDCIVKVKISFGIDKNLLSKLHNKMFGLSTKFTTSSNNLRLSLITNFLLLNIFENSLFINSILLS